MKTLILCVLFLTSVVLSQAPESACSNLAFLSQIGAYDIPNKKAKITDSRTCPSLVSAKSTCCDKVLLTRISNWWNRDQLINSIKVLSSRNIDYAMYVKSVNKLYDDLVFNFRSNIQERAEAVINLQNQYSSTSPKGKNFNQKLLDAAKFLYDSSNWDKLINAETGFLKIRETEATKCFDNNEKTVNGLICGICQDETIQRFVSESKTIKSETKTVWTIRFLQTEAIAFSTSCQGYLLNQLKIFPFFDHLNFLFSFSKKGSIENQNPLSLDERALGDDYLLANITKNLSDCAQAGADTTKCAKVAQVYMRLGLQTDLDLKSEKVLVDLQSAIQRDFDPVYDQLKNALYETQHRKQVVSHKSEKEPKLDMISFQYMDRDLKSNPFVLATLLDFPTTGAKSGLSTATSLSSMISISGFLAAKTICPMSSVFGSNGTSESRFRDRADKAKYCTNMDRSCCSPNSITKLSKGMKNVMDRFLDEKQNWVIFIRENLRLSANLMSKTSNISIAILNKCGEDQTCVEALNR